MIEEKAERIVEKIKTIQKNSYSDYAAFRLHSEHEGNFFDCFIINNIAFHSSNFSVQLEEISDAVRIIRRLTGENSEEIMEQLTENGSYYDLQKPLFMHYLKLPKNKELHTNS